MAPQDDQINPYELLGIEVEASEAEIRKAYRQKSLKVHPDRNPNNADAAAKFHELNQAYELLLDPTKRSTLDAGIRAKLAQKARYSKFDAKRKAFQDELEQAERAAKRSRDEKEERERARKQEAERIQEEGRKLREAKMEQIRKVEEEERAREAEAKKPFEIGPLDTTVRVKYPLSEYPNLTTPSAVSSLLSPFGLIDEDSIVLSMKPSKKNPNKPPKFATALAPFFKVNEAHAAVCASGVETRGLKNVEITWASGQEPAIIQALKRRQQPTQAEALTSSSHVSSADISFTTSHHAPGPSASGSSSTPSFSFDPFEAPQTSSAPTAAGLDYESITLMRLRQAERERLEREIREQEAASS